MPEERIIKEDQSVNTLYNMSCSKKVIEQDAESLDDVNIAFSTTIIMCSAVIHLQTRPT